MNAEGNLIRTPEPGNEYRIPKTAAVRCEYAIVSRMAVRFYAFLISADELLFSESGL